MHFEIDQTAFDIIDKTGSFGHRPYETARHDPVFPRQTDLSIPSNYLFIFGEIFAKYPKTRETRFRLGKPVCVAFEGGSVIII